MTKFSPILYKRDVKKSQSTILSRSDLRQRIELIDNWTDGLKHKKLVEALQSSFRTLNTRARYPYYWDETTTTHEKFITFLISLKKIFLETGVKKPVFEDFYSICDRYIPSTGTTYATLYYIFKIYNLKYLDLYALDYDFTRIDYERFKDEIQQRDWIYLKDNLDIIAKVSKKVKKNKSVPSCANNEVVNNTGETLNPFRKSKPKKVDKVKKKSKLDILSEVFND